ncbi:molybdenum cofactor guanylyltransferase [Catalinimonas niigatensis]|uniref:molybdenum cofactor guanylyltransferase n=1 Tax=Catalinimonas niigatensis TaxID=1397264 RepID=UPI0026667381|nr:molybdenum cofactor guanylyltransferase [Catalinimonas niigatensis]WPP52868.1 molybdenum cofactor guanylyltransferase [Catalinimonas niigatensis]
MQNIPQDLIAIILSGGQSRRMGQDKGLLQNDGMGWVEALQQKLAEVPLPVYVSINLEQKMPYEAVLPPQKLILDNSSFLHINGPLKGILSAHQAFPDKHLLLLPCDMLMLNAEVFYWWIKTFQQQEQMEPVVVCKAENQLQPLCGIYSHHALKKLHTLYQQGQLEDQSMHAIIKNVLHAQVLEVPAALLPLFKNFNTPDDLKE